MHKQPIIVDLHEGDGRAVQRRDIVRVKLSIMLNRGDVILDNHICDFQVGARSVIAGLEKGVIGMKAEGERHISFGPHLGYRDRAHGPVPAHAQLICQVTLLRLWDEEDPDAPTGVRRMIKRKA